MADDKYISQITPLGSSTTYLLKDKKAIENITRSGTTFTATRRDGTTFTFTQQDNNSVTGVKGNAESSYRTGNINLTLGNLIGTTDIGSTNTPIWADGGVLKSVTANKVLINLASETEDSIYKTTPRPGIIGILGITHGGTGASTELEARQNLDIPQEDIVSYFSNNSNKHYIKTSLICGSSNFFIGFRIIAESTYARKKPSIIIGSSYWNTSSDTFTNPTYYDATKNVDGIELIVGDDNKLFIAIQPHTTYQRYRVFVYYGTNRNSNYAIEATQTAPTATVTVAMTRVPNYDATRLASDGTTAQFWRGDNVWSNELSGGLLKITNNSNTVTIGSANASYMHFSNSADIPFYFNKSLWIDGDLYPYGTTNTRSLGSSSKRWKSLLIGTNDSYGGTSKPIYWKDGVPTVLSDTVGAADKPIFLSSGTITESTSTIGSGITPIYMASGQIKASTSTIGTFEKPIYLNAGTITALNPVWLLSGGTATADNEDLNAEKYRAIGNYYSNRDAKSKTILNSPFGAAASTNCLSFTLKTEASLGTGTTYLRQLWRGYNSGVEAERTSTNSGSSWSTWRTKVFKNSDATTTQGNGEQPIYIAANGQAVNTTYYLKANIESGTEKNRAAYYSDTRKIEDAGSIYMTASTLGVNQTSITSGQTFEVTGKAHINNTTSNNGTTATPPAFSVGTLTGTHIGISPSGIQAKNNATTATLNLNYYGGSVVLGQPSTPANTTINGILTIDRRNYTYTTDNRGTLINLINMRYNNAGGSKYYEKTILAAIATNETDTTVEGASIFLGSQGGALILGAGESPATAQKNNDLNSNKENIYLIADSGMLFYTNADNAKHKVTIDSNGLTVEESYLRMRPCSATYNVAATDSFGSIFFNHDKENYPADTFITGNSLRAAQFIVKHDHLVGVAPTANKTAVGIKWTDSNNVLMSRIMSYKWKNNATHHGLYFDLQSAANDGHANIFSLHADDSISDIYYISLHKRINTSLNISATAGYTANGENGAGSTLYNNGILYLNATAGNWAYIRLNNSVNKFDIATKSTDDSGYLQFRPNGVATYASRLDHSGNWLLKGTIGESVNGGLIILDENNYKYNSTGMPGSSGENTGFRIGLLKQVASKIDRTTSTLFAGTYWPNSRGWLFGEIYNPNVVDSTSGLPQYSSFIGSNLASKNPWIFGTNNYVEYEYALASSSNDMFINQGAANKAAYYSAAGEISQASSIFMDISHITVNGTATPANSGRFQVIGTSTMRTILPEATNTYELGSNLLRWGTVFLKGDIGINWQMSKDTFNAKTFLSIRNTNNEVIGTIGYHNTGNTNGALYLIPHHILQGDYEYSGEDGLYIGQTSMRWENQFRFRKYDASITTNRTSAGAIRALLITGTTYGNDAAYLESTTNGDFSLGDPGPQIQFGTSAGTAKAAIIYTNHDSNGLAGSSFQFVSDENPINLVAGGIVGKTRAVFGQRALNTSYTLYVNGTTKSQSNLFVGAKATYNDNNAGWYLGADGTMWGTHASSGAHIYLKDDDNSHYMEINPDNLTGNIRLSGTADRFIMPKLNIASTADIGGKTSSSPPLSIGTLTSTHIEIDSNEILAKNSDTTTGTLWLQDEDGLTGVAGSKGLSVKTSGENWLPAHNNTYVGGIRMTDVNSSGGAINWIKSYNTNADISRWWGMGTVGHAWYVVSSASSRGSTAGRDRGIFWYGNTGRFDISDDGYLTTGNLTIGGKVNTEAGKTIVSSSTLYLKTSSSASVIFSINNTNQARFDTHGYLRPEANNTLQVGTSDYKWNAMYATTFYGALSGNATSADKVNHTLTINLNKTSGGTTFNGSANAAVTFYAPTAGGTSGYVLTSAGNAAPVWTAQTALTSVFQTLTSATNTLTVKIGGTEKTAALVNSVSNTWGAGTTAGPTITTTVNGKAGAAVAIPVASASASGVVTTGNQTFEGRKTMKLISPHVYDGTGNTSRHKYIYFNNHTGNQAVGYIRYDSGNATNVTAGQFGFMEYSHSSTASPNPLATYEFYYLPAVAADIETSVSYPILTGKSAVTVAQGGTGIKTMSYKNAVLIGNSSTVTSAMQPVRTASGAFYATAQDAKPTFGTLPVAQGGTGKIKYESTSASVEYRGITFVSSQPSASSMTPGVIYFVYDTV